MNYKSPMFKRPPASLNGWLSPLWLALLVCSSVAFSLGFACATPFAAFSAVAALTLDRRDAVFLTGGVWFANQFVGFTLLHYPWTVSSIGWGFALGLAAMLATFGARWATRTCEGLPWVAEHLAALLAAFAVFEGVLFMVGLFILGGMEAFGLRIVSWIFVINAGAFLGLLILHRLVRLLGFKPARVAGRLLARG
jgi:hypothetical protein